MRLWIHSMQTKHRRQSEIRFLGTSDDVTSCDCCGRQNLKSTVAIDIDGEVVYYGVTCAALALRSTAKSVRTETRKADREREVREQAERTAARKAEVAPWLTWLAANGSGSDTFRQIESLGGYKVARARFVAEGGAQ